jgi:hypothetical protein
LKLIPQWRRWWRMNSVQVFGLIAALPVVWSQLPDDVKAMVPAEWRAGIIVALGLAGAILRLRDQGIAR